MIVNGKVIDPSKMGHAFTYTSKQLTDKFYNLDRIMFSMSPFLTDDEAWLILTEAEKRAQSKYEGNWTAGDCIQFCKDLLGESRWEALEMAWEINSQNAVQELFAPEQLREAWVHKLSMTEGTAEEVALNPNDYIMIKTPKDKGRKIIVY
jgi:hypothetical protein